MYGFNPTLGSDYWNNGSSSSNSSGSDWKTDWNTIGGYSNSSVKPYPPIVSPRDDSNWKEALSKAAGYLAGTGRDRYRQKGEQQPQTQFTPQSGGGAFNQIAPDTTVFMPQQQQPFTIAAQQQQGGGIGSTIGGAIGTVGGAFIGGPFGASVGGSVGSSIGGLFG